MKLIKLIGIVFLILISLFSINASEVNYYYQADCDAGSGGLQYDYYSIDISNLNLYIVQGKTQTQGLSGAYTRQARSFLRNETNATVLSSYSPDSTTDTDGPNNYSSSAFGDWIFIAVGRQEGNGFCANYARAWIDLFIKEINITTFKINNVSITPTNGLYSNSSTPSFNITWYQEYTNNNINTSYRIDSNSTYNQVGTNTLNPTFNLPTLSEGTHTINFYAYSNDTWFNETYNLTVDLTNPDLSVSSFTEENSYIINFSNIINISDTNLLNCNISIDNGDSTICTNQSYTFSTNGNHTFNVTALDYANNSINSNNNIIFINPKFYVYFQNSSSSPITNFTINSTNYINYFTGNIYDYGLGSHSFLFEKLGLDSSTFDLTFNSTSNINTTLNIPGAKIQITVYDITDYSVINTNTTIEIIGDSFSGIYYTSTGYLNITSLEMEEETYGIVVSNADYETTSISFNYNNQEVLEVAAYMTPNEVNGSLIADILVNVIDDYSNPIKNINVLQYVWDSGQSEYIQSNLKATDYNGQTSFKVFLNTKRYNFCAEYQGILYCETDLFININTQEITIEIPLSDLDVQNSSSIYDIDFSYSLTNTTVSINATNYTSVTFTYNNPNQDIDQYCLKIYEIVNLQRSLVANQCSSSYSSALSVNIIENRSKNYIAIATIEKDTSLRELASLELYATYDLQDELDRFGFIKLLLLIVVGFIIGVALYKKVHDIRIAHLGLPVVFLIFVIFLPEYVSFESFVLIGLVNIFAWKIATQKDDLRRDAKFSTLNSILVLYMIFIFGLYTALTEIDNKGLLDDYGTTILDNIDDENSYFDQFTNQSINKLQTKRANANTGAWEIVTSVFLKGLEFVDLFFSILSNLFTIATNLSLIIGIKNTLLLKFVKIIDYSIVAFVVYFYFKEAFK